jgi:DNA polymerase-3 subunit alpha
VTFEDLTGAMEVMVFPDNYAALARPLAVGDTIVVTGQLDRRDDQPKLKATQVLSLDEAREQLLRELVLHLPLEDWLDGARWTQLRELVMDAPGPIKLRLVCSRAGTEKIELAPADHYGVVWTPEFKTRLEGFLQGAKYELRATTQLARAKKRAWQQRS